MSETLIERIKRHEGFRAQVYKDSLGKLTIGIGRLIEAPGGISEAEAEILLNNDLNASKKALSVMLPWANALDEVRNGVLVEMSFQLGVNGLLKFKKFLSSMQMNDWESAANNMLDSLWAVQTPGRAYELSTIIKSGIL